MQLDPGTEEMASEVRAVLTSLVLLATSLVIDNTVCLLGRAARLCPWGTATQKCAVLPLWAVRVVLPSKQTVLSITSDVDNKTKLVSTALTLVAIFSVPGASGTTRL